jgi:HEAT repeat protein
MALPVELNSRPVFWLGAADARQSLELINGLYDQAATLNLKKELVSAVEVHDDSPIVVAWLDRRLRSSDPDEVRAEAAEGLAWHPIPAALAALDRAARHDVSRVRQEAAEALGDLKMPEAADTLIALAKSLDDHAARREAVEALGERPEPSALEALGAIAKQDADLDIQREAVETLGDVKDRRGVPLLMEIARKHPNPDVRREAVETLGDALPGEASVDLLKEIAREDPHPDVQAEAVETLGDIDRPDARAAVQDLMRTHKEPRVRVEAIETMVDHATSRETVQVLSDIIQKDTDIQVRREAVDRLHDVHDEAAKQVLIDLARTHADEDIRAEAVESLGDGEWAAALGDVLKQIALSDKSTRVQHEALDVLAGLPDGKGIDALIQIAREHTDQDTRKQALEVLMDSKHPRARAIFDRALQKP